MPILLNGNPIVKPVDNTSLKIHIDDKSNPHDVTYSQIGAAASIHTHSVDQLTTNVAPKPQSTTGIGQWWSGSVSDGNSNLYLPSGGTWAYITNRSNIPGVSGGIASGGASIGAVHSYWVDNQQHYHGLNCVAWRIN